MIGIFKINKFIDARTVEASADIDENIIVRLICNRSTGKIHRKSRRVIGSSQSLTMFQA